MYLLVFPDKYCRVIFDHKVDSLLQDICLELDNRYEIRLLEMPTNKANVHFLLQSSSNVFCCKLSESVKDL